MSACNFPWRQRDDERQRASLHDRLLQSIYTKWGSNVNIQPMPEDVSDEMCLRGYLLFEAVMKEVKSLFYVDVTFPAGIMQLIVRLNDAAVADAMRREFGRHSGATLVRTRKRRAPTFVVPVNPGRPPRRHALGRTLKPDAQRYVDTVRTAVRSTGSCAIPLGSDKPLEYFVHRVLFAMRQCIAQFLVYSSHGFTVAAIFHQDQLVMIENETPT